MMYRMLETVCIKSSDQQIQYCWVPGNEAIIGLGLKNKN